MTRCSSSIRAYSCARGNLSQQQDVKQSLAAFPCANLPDSFFSSFPAPSYLLLRAHRRRRTHLRRASSTPVGSRCTTFNSTRHTASLPPGNRAIRTIHLVRHPTPRPTYFPSWPDWALSNLNYLSTTPASKTAQSCGPIRPGTALFVQEIAQADRLADAALQRSGADSNALFVKSLTLGLRADNAGLIEKQSFAALSYTKEARVFAERLLQAKPEAADAYFGPGMENYLLSLKPAPLRVLLRVTGSNVDRERGLRRDSRDGASRSLPGAICKAAAGGGGVAR